MYADSFIAFSFVHPALAWIGLAAGMIPVLIHLLNRRRYRTIRWAAMPFLQSAIKRSARRLRLEHWLLLAARVALVVLLGMAVARPYVESFGILPLRATAVHRIVLLDNSLSMNANTGEGVTRFEKAKECAQSLVASFRSQDPISLVTLAAPAQTIIAEGTVDHRFVRQRLERVNPTQRATDSAGALRETLKLLNRSAWPKNNRAVYLISDLGRGDWQSEHRGQPTSAVSAAQQVADALSESTAGLTVIPIGRTAYQNVAVTDLAVRSPLGGVDVPLRVECRIENLGRSVADGLVLQVRRDGQLERRLELPMLEPNTAYDTDFPMVFSTPGTHLIEVKVSGTRNDLLGSDNTRYLSVEVRRTTPVLLVDGHPGSNRFRGEAGFLATALAPSVGRSTVAPLDPRVITEPELLGEPLLGYAMIALCNVERLSQLGWDRLQQFVARGGGLLVFLGDRVSVENYNRYGFADGQGLLPNGLAGIHTEVDTKESLLSFKLTDPAHSVVADFVDQTQSGLFSARVHQYYELTPVINQSDTVLRFTNDAPALVASSYGRGRVLLMTTSANLNWTNLPTRGDYVSLMLNATAFVLPTCGQHRNMLVGEFVREPIQPEQRDLPLRLTWADGPLITPSLVPEEDRLVVVYGPIEEATPLTLSIGSESFVFVANTDPAESDLTSVDKQTFLSGVDRPVHWIEGADDLASVQTTGGSTELGSATLLAVLVLLFVEMWLSLWFGSYRAAASGKSPDAPIHRTWGARTLAARLRRQDETDSSQELTVER